MGLTKKQIAEVKKHLENAQNPVFFFDNDQDGLCSFLILRRYIGRGRGFPIKGSPDLSKDFFRKVQEFNSDYIFVLDKPKISDEFFEEAKKFNIPFVWIDHHENDRKKIPKFVNYYNPLFNRKKTNEPVTYLCSEISTRKEDAWLGIIGCVSDNFVPKFYKNFKKKYPELCVSPKNESAFDIFYNSEIGRIARIFGFALKDATSNVITMIKFLFSAKGPYDILEEKKENRIMHRRFFDIEKKYSELIKKAKSKISDGDKLIFFRYAGDTSMSSEIANGLKYIFPEKDVVVAYTKGAKVNISARGKNIREKIVKIISGLENATGGGHENAVGAQIKKEDLEKFEGMVREFY